MPFICKENFDGGKGCEGVKGELYTGGRVEELLAEGLLARVESAPAAALKEEWPVKPSKDSKKKAK